MDQAGKLPKARNYENARKADPGVPMRHLENDLALMLAGERIH